MLRSESAGAARRRPGSGMAQQDARIRLPYLGVGTTLTAAVVALGLLVLASGLIAIVSFTQIRRSFDRVASSQTASIAAARLSQSSDALAGFAPSLFAKGGDQTSPVQFSQQVDTQRQHLQGLVTELSGYLGPNEAIATIRSTSDELFETIGLLSTAIFSKTAAEENLRRALAAMGAVLDEAVTLSGQPGGAPIARWLDTVRGVTPDVFTVLAAADTASIDGPSTKAGIVIANAEEIAAAAGGETAAGTRAAAPALPGLQRRFAEAVTGDEGAFATQRRIVDLDEQLRRLLARNEAAAKRMIGALGAVMETVRVDIAGQNASRSALISTRTWWLTALTLIGAIGAICTAVHVRTSVARRLRNAILSEPAASSAASLAEGRDEIANDGGTGAIYADITELKPAEEAMREAKDTAEARIEDAPDAAIGR